MIPFDWFRSAERNPGRVPTHEQAHPTDLRARLSERPRLHSLADENPDVPLDAWGWIAIGVFSPEGTTTDFP